MTGLSKTSVNPIHFKRIITLSEGCVDSLEQAGLYVHQVLHPDENDIKSSSSISTAPVGAFGVSFDEAAF